MQPGISAGISFEMGRPFQYPLVLLKFHFVRRCEQSMAGVNALSVVKYPVILLTNWMKTILQKSPRFLLGGHDIGGSAYMGMLEEFWDNFRLVDDSHPIYQKDPSRRKRTIPIALHGDEGRGLSRAPVLILSYQVLIPFTGVESLNASVQLALNSFVVDCVIYLFAWLLPNGHEQGLNCLCV